MTPELTNALIAIARAYKPHDKRYKNALKMARVIDRYKPSNRGAILAAAYIRALARRAK